MLRVWVESCKNSCIAWRNKCTIPARFWTSNAQTQKRIQYATEANACIFCAILEYLEILEGFGKDEECSGGKTNMPESYLMCVCDGFMDG